mgnify:CR=1 FL=1
MVRWVRLAAKGALSLSLLVVGGCVVLFAMANSAWVPLSVPPWLVGLFDDPKMEMWVPGLLAGWLVALLSLAFLLVWSLFYVRRRRQYESLIASLERELVDLRNLPFTSPAPLEDLPEQPDADAAKALASPDIWARRSDGDSAE